MIKSFLCICFFLLFVGFNSYSQYENKKDSIKYFIEDFTKFLVLPININSQNADFSPIILKNNLVFVSGREYQYGVIYTSKNKDELLDLFECEKIDSVTFKEPKPFSKVINTNFNDGPACINNKNNLIVFSSNTKKKPDKKSKSKKNNLQLYLSKKRSDIWSDPTLVKFCKSKYSFSHPCFGQDQNSLYFSSNMPGGFGGMDIYYSIYANNIWSTPINLGPSINTMNNEVFPFISTNNILYFSLKDSSGYGGLDIYSFNLNDSLNAKKKLLEKPINSSHDDFGVFIDSTGKKGYFSSNRIKNNKDDIFYFCSKQPAINNCLPYINTAYCYTFFEESTLQNDNNSGLIYEWDLGDGTKIRSLEAKHCFKEAGKYKIELNIIDKLTNSVSYNEASYDFEVEETQQINLNCPDTVIINSPVLIDSYKSSIPGYSIEKYYWDFGNGCSSTGIAGYYTFKSKGETIIRLIVTAKDISNGSFKDFCYEKRIVIEDSL